MENIMKAKDDADAQSRSGEAGANLTAGLGDEFIYMGVTMVCIAHKAILDNFIIDCVEAHYFNANGDLKTCVLPPNSWKAIKSPNVKVRGAHK